MRLLASLFLVALALPLPAEASASLRDAFFAAVKVRKAENELSLLQSLDDGSLASTSAQEKSAASLTQARISFHSVLLADGDELELWESDLLREKSRPADGPRRGLASVGSGTKSAPYPNPQHLSFLKTFLPEARGFSALEWRMVTEWFGAPTQEAFLAWAFALAEIQPEKGAIPKGVLLVESAWRSSVGSAERELSRELGGASLRLSAFEKAEEQAEDLKRQLLSRTEPVVLVSSGEASAVVLTMLDRFPGIRQSPMLLGWVNVDGQLYGKGKSSSGRSPSSMEKIAQAESERLELEGLERPTPLGPGFPIINLISLGKDRVAAGTLRGSLVTDGASLYVKVAPAWRAISAAVRQLSTMPRQP